MPQRSRSADDVHALPLPVFGGRGEAVANVSVVSSAAELRRIGPDLEALRLRSASPETLVAMPGWFEAYRPAAGWTQRVLLSWSGTGLETRLDAAIFLRERTILGMPTGYFYGGDALGDTLILCDAGQEQRLVSEGIALLLRRHRGFLVLLDNILPAKFSPALRFEQSLRVRSTVDSVTWQHGLESSFEDTLKGFGRRTRRNLRYALRRVERNGWQFFADLTPAQLGEAISQLSSRSTHPFPMTMGTMRLQLTAKTPGSLAMGLADADGNWLSCLVGRRILVGTRSEGAAEIFWQSNAAGYATDSLCTTMRSLFMRSEVARGTAQVRYIGGTCELMQHCCTPSPSLQISVARQGLRTIVLQGLLHRLPKAGHPRRQHFVDGPGN